jgi:hypothetical protein
MHFSKVKTYLLIRENPVVNVVGLLLGWIADSFLTLVLGKLSVDGPAISSKSSSFAATNCTIMSNYLEFLNFYQTFSFIIPS